MTHAYHEKPRIVLGDDCDECVRRASSLERMHALDPFNLAKLGELALMMHENPKATREELGASYADLKAVENLRYAARLVYTAGITRELAR